MSARFSVSETPLAGAVVLERLVVGDQRGFLERLWCDAELGDLVGGKPIRQINRALTAKRGAVRGMHFQRPPHAEAKMVHCVRGRIYDVAVDLRDGSATFGRWHGVELAGDEHRTFVIPEGFAHGFQALTDDCELIYFHTAAFCQAGEGGVSPIDPALGITWPLPITDLSQRDAGLPPLAQGIVLS